MTAISWKPAAAIALVVIVAAAGAFVLLKRDGGGTGDGELPGDNAQAGEVLFKYEASFTYRGSAENIPLIGYAIEFPCPTVDGEPVIKRENLRWQLWGPVEGENGARWMELEVDNNNDNVFHLVGQRENRPGLNLPGVSYGDLGCPYHLLGIGGLSYWDNSITWKITLQNDFDNLYIGETLKSEGYFSLPAENTSRVTLQENDGRVLGGFSISWNYDNVQNIDISFSAQLSKQVNNNFETVEQFSKVAENAPEGYRYPINLL